MIRYIDKTVLESQETIVSSFGIYSKNIERELEISFQGMQWQEPKENILEATTLLVRLIQRQKGNNTIVPFEEKWIKEFTIVLVPTGVWNGMKLGQLTQEKILIALGDGIAELSVDSGEVIWSKKYANTPIDIIQLSSTLDGLYILYNYYKFKSNLIKSNLIKIDLSGKILWVAQPKSKNDFFTVFNCTNKILSANTWDGWSVKLNEQSGKIIDANWTK